MPYIKAIKTYRTKEIDVSELLRLLEESRKSVHECKTVPSMPAVRP